MPKIPIGGCETCEDYANVGCMHKKFWSLCSRVPQDSKAESRKVRAKLAETKDQNREKNSGLVPGGLGLDFGFRTHKCSAQNLLYQLTIRAIPLSSHGLLSLAYVIYIAYVKRNLTKPATPDQREAQYSRRTHMRSVKSTISCLLQDSFERSKTKRIESAKSILIFFHTVVDSNIIKQNPNPKDVPSDKTLSISKQQNKHDE